MSCTISRCCIGMPPLAHRYASNTDRACYTTTSFRTGHNPELAPSTSVITHPVISKRFLHKHKIDYMSNIRPDTETMNQTLRMLATYETDHVHAQQANMHIPHMSPAPDGKNFHPDVRLSGLAYATARTALEATQLRGTRTRPASAHPTIGRNVPAVRMVAGVPYVVTAPGPGPGPAPARPSTARAAATSLAPNSPAPSTRPAAAPAPAAPAATHSSHPAAALPSSPAGKPLRPTSAHASPRAGGPQQQATMKQRPASAHPTASPSDTLTRRVHWGGML